MDDLLNLLDQGKRHAPTANRSLTCLPVTASSTTDSCASVQVRWLTEELGFDVGINYKTSNVDAELRKAAPDGIDCFYDNVGANILDTVLLQMNLFGRVCLCGAIST
jgi:NADPH-dependent curcumin reductase CurA